MIENFVYRKRKNISGKNSNPDKASIAISSCQLNRLPDDLSPRLICFSHFEAKSASNDNEVMTRAWGLRR